MSLVTGLILVWGLLCQSIWASNTPTCEDTDGTSGDRDGRGCNFYDAKPHLCAQFDYGSFVSLTMCCSCGGGIKKGAGSLRPQQEGTIEPPRREGRPPTPPTRQKKLRPRQGETTEPPRRSRSPHTEPPRGKADRTRRTRAPRQANWSDQTKRPATRPATRPEIRPARPTPPKRTSHCLDDHPQLMLMIHI